MVAECPLFCTAHSYSILLRIPVSTTQVGPGTAAEEKKKRIQMMDATTIRRVDHVSTLRRDVVRYGRTPVFYSKLQ
jgi:hypothetical protein